MPSTDRNLTLPLDQEHVFLEAQRELVACLWCPGCFCGTVPDPSEFAQSFVGIIVDFPSNLPSLTGHVMSYFESLVGRQFLVLQSYFFPIFLLKCSMHL